MISSTFYLLKKTGALADATSAVGLAVLLEKLTQRVPDLRDAGPCFEIRLPGEPVDLETLPYEHLRAYPLYLYVSKGADADSPTDPSFSLDYFAEQAKARAAREAEKAKRASKKVAKAAGKAAKASGIDLVEQEAAGEARSDFYLYQHLNVLQAFGGHNSLHAAIRRADPVDLSVSVRMKLEALAEGRDAASVTTPFTYAVSAVQGFNPLVGKGVNRPKPDGASVSSLDKKWADWFEEWLRYIGTQNLAYGAAVGVDNKDIKLMALVPGDVRLHALTKTLRNALFTAAAQAWSSSLLDVCGVLEVARHLIRHSEVYRPDFEWTILGVTPRDRVAGVATTYFKALGTGRAVANLSFIALPGWFPVADAEAAGDWLEIIEEHLGIVRFLREDRAEEYSLIRSYRDFLSGHSLWSFLIFAAAYATHVLRAREKKRPVRQLTTTNLGKVVVHMERRYKSIVENEGFRSIATAMRRGTVSEQFHKSQGRQQYEIHYGLYHELRRAAGSKGTLLRAVSDYVGAYNAENARAMERGGERGQAVGGRPKRPRARVGTHDIEAFAGLVDEFGSEIVAYLLVAYASATEPREIEATPGEEAANGTGPSEETAEAGEAG